MKSISLICVWAAITPVFSILHAQSPARQPFAIKASIGDVTDNRTTGSFFSECKLELKFTGDAATDAATVRQVRVKKAVDELGRDLTRDDNRDSFASFSSSQRNGVLKTDVRLRKPSRN